VPSSSMLSPVAARAVAGRYSSGGNDDIWTTYRGSHDEEQPKSADEKRTYPTRYLLTCLIGYSMSFIVFGSQVSILGPTIAGLAKRLNVEEPDLSPLFTALGVSCIISGTPSGWLVDRLPTHHVLVGSLLVEVRRPGCMAGDSRSCGVNCGSRWAGRGVGTCGTEVTERRARTGL
jgi:hypothetical protein